MTMDTEVYASEAAHNLRNQGIAHLLESYDRLYFDSDVATDVYTMQCSVLVNARDLAVMGATVADGGVNPVTGDRVIDEEHCARGTGCTTPACPARAASVAASSPLPRARAASGPGHRRWTRPATACGARP